MRLKFIYSCIIFLIVFTNGSFQYLLGQNLVPDSSFESNKFIPMDLSAIGASNSWTSPTWGTTDLFCKCGKKQIEISNAQVPKNPFGYQVAHTGNCYAGIYAFSHGDYREYLLTQLNNSLIPAMNYKFTMWVSLADFSRVAVDQLGVCFLSTALTYSHSNDIRNLSPIYIHIKEEIGTDTLNWHELTFNYKAKGGEKYLLIGSFTVNDLDITNVMAPKNVRTKINQKTERDAYYYIDDVSLIADPPPLITKEDTTTLVYTNPLVAFSASATVQEVPIQTQVSSIPELEMDKPLILKNVLFETNEAVLLRSSFPELDIVVNHLNAKPELKIKINGYTDNRGTENQNLKLSELRAKSVADYLEANGISKKRITYEGLGSKHPISNNDTEAGRTLNRRVEFVLTN